MMCSKCHIKMDYPKGRTPGLANLAVCPSCGKTILDCVPPNKIWNENIQGLRMIKNVKTN